jgi:peptidoglycan/LPS O-acetylase OafA/YrhL
MTQSPAARLAGHLPTLDGWRAVAILLVIVSHQPQFASPRVKALGPVGVSLFFGLSGLLICNRLLAERQRHGRNDLVGFYVRRAARILPPALGYLAVLAALTAAGVLAVAGPDLRACLLFYRNYAGGGWYTDHFWSLAVEEHFYLAFPALLALAGPRRCTAAAVGLALAVTAWRWADGHWGLITGTPDWPKPYYRTDCRLDELLLGCAAALIAERYADRLRGWLAQAAGAAGLALLAARVAGAPVPGLALAALVPWALLGTVVRPRGPLGRVLEWAPLAWVGRMSYSLYLWQQLFFVAYPGNRAAGLGWLQDWPWNALGLPACAAASHYLLERPLTRLGRALAERRRAAAASRGEEAALALVDQREPVAQQVHGAPIVVRRPADRRQ